MLPNPGESSAPDRVCFNNDLPGDGIGGTDFFVDIGVTLATGPLVDGVTFVTTGSVIVGLLTVGCPDWFKMGVAIGMWTTVGLGPC